MSANASVSLRSCRRIPERKASKNSSPLYLKGTRRAISVKRADAPGLSATTVVRLKDVWRREYEAWSKRDLQPADGIYSNVRLDGTAVSWERETAASLLAVLDGVRESELSWQELLNELPRIRRRRDGLLGGLAEGLRQPAAWLHKTANVLPQSMQGKAAGVRDRESADGGGRSGPFQELIRPVECRDRKVLLAFYFPAETGGTCGRRTRSNPPLRRSDCGSDERGLRSREASLTMVFMLARQAERHWRRLNGSEVIVRLDGKEFDGLMVNAA